MNQYSTDLAQIFEFFCLQTYRDVSGVVCFESNTPGPTVGICALTHGNEPAGLAALQKLYRLFSKTPPPRGRVFLMVHNIEAGKAFFHAKNDQKRRISRYIDINMNRLPEDTLSLENDTRYEIMRARELFPIWKKLTHALDIHSMTSRARPMIISRDTSARSRNLVSRLGIPLLISNMGQVQIGLPVFSFFGMDNKRCVALGLEAGRHQDTITLIRAEKVALSFLRQAGILEGVREKHMPYTEYRVKQPLIFPSIEYDLTRRFRTYDMIKKGEVLATSPNHPPLIMPFDGAILFPTEYRKKDKDISEEVGFLSTRIDHSD